MSGPNIKPVIPKNRNPIITPNTVTTGCTFAIFLAKANRMILSLDPITINPHAIKKMPCQMCPCTRRYNPIGIHIKEVPTNGIIEAKPDITLQKLASCTPAIKYAMNNRIPCMTIIRGTTTELLNVCILNSDVNIFV